MLCVVLLARVQGVSYARVQSALCLVVVSHECNVCCACFFFCTSAQGCVFVFCTRGTSVFFFFCACVFHQLYNIGVREQVLNLREFQRVSSHLNGSWHVVLCTGGGWFRYRSFSGEELLRDHPASLRCAPRQGHLRERPHVHADSGPLRTQVFLVGPLGRGRHWQIPHGS